MMEFTTIAETVGMTTLHMILNHFPAAPEVARSMSSLLSTSTTLSTVSAVAGISAGLSVFCGVLDPAKALFEAETRTEISGRVDVPLLIEKMINLFDYW